MKKSNSAKKPTINVRDLEPRKDAKGGVSIIDTKNKPIKK